MLALILTFLMLPHTAEIEAWRQRRAASLTSDAGWLTVTGLFWLKEGPNRFGSDASNEIVLPATAPAHAGIFEFHSGKVLLTMDGRTHPMASDEQVTIGPLTMFVIERGGRYAIRLRDKKSQYRRDFSGLHYFPIRESYRVTAKWVAELRKIPVTNVLGMTEPMESPGYAVFQVGGQECKLYPVIEEPDAKELFYIFRDQTSAHETYGAGRFLYSEMPKDGSVVLDFNKAYNPPCAFTPYATCPLPPKENRLSVRIEAGELKYGDH